MLAIPKKPNSRPSKLYAKNWLLRVKGLYPAIVKVTWLDACGGSTPRFNINDSNWAQTTEFGVINQSVGYLLLMDEDFTVLAAEISEAHEVRDITEIPTATVLNVETLVKGTR